jgi:hypothetical protein
MQVAIPSLTRRFKIAAVLAVVPLISAQRAPAQTKPDPLERTIPVSVMTQEGEVVRGLGPDCFRATFHHEPVRVASAEQSPPHRIVLLLDTSESMMGENHLPPLLIAGRVLNASPASIPIAFLTFSGKVETRTKLDLDRQPAWAQVRRLETLPWDVSAPHTLWKTAVVDAIAEGLHMLEPAQTGDGMITVSDFEDNFSKTSPRDLKGPLARSEVRLFLIGTTHSPTTTRRGVVAGYVDPGALAAIAEEGGGDHWSFYIGDFGWLKPGWLAKHHSPNDKSLMPLLVPTQHLLDEMNDFYALKIRLPEPVEKPEKWKLEVVDPKTGKPDRHLVLHYPSQLTAPPQ